MICNTDVSPWWLLILIVYKHFYAFLTARILLCLCIDWSLCKRTMIPMTPLRVFWGFFCDIFTLNFSNLDCVYSASLTKPFHDLTSLHKYEIILTFNSCLVLSFGLNRFWSRDQPSLTTFKRYYYLFLFISYRMATWNKTSPTLFKRSLNNYNYFK